VSWTGSIGASTPGPRAIARWPSHQSAYAMISTTAPSAFGATPIRLFAAFARVAMRSVEVFEQRGAERVVRDRRVRVALVVGDELELGAAAQRGALRIGEFPAQEMHGRGLRLRAAVEVLVGVERRAAVSGNFGRHAVLDPFQSRELERALGRIGKFDQQ